MTRSRNASWARSYPHADHELTAEEVRQLYGPLIDAFFEALRTDVGVLVSMAEQATKIVARRETAQRVLQTKARIKAEREAAAATSGWQLSR